MKILLGVTGSVATVYTNKLITTLQLFGYEVRVIKTKSATELSKNCQDGGGHLDECCTSYDDRSERWENLGDPILHIDLRNWADVFVIAPLSMNTLAKMATGVCDNLLTQVVRAWDYSKPIIVCPAANTMMWENSPTQEQIELLKSRGVLIIPPVIKTLACGDTGIGAMCNHEDIVVEIVSLSWANPLGKPFFIPTDNHPGAFGVERRHETHSGVDLYCEDGDPVYAVEDGEIVNVENFTGCFATPSSPWWENTKCVMVRGESGIVNYGELWYDTRNPWVWFDPIFNSRKVKRGTQIGSVAAVLKPDKVRADIPNHSNAMLHLELYRNDMKDLHPKIWPLYAAKPRDLLNPTHRLKLVNS